MTIVAKLSRRLDETLGDEAAETMIDWMQGVDAHRSELRELNDLASDRIDARLGQQTAELRHELHTEIGKVNERVTELRQEMHTEITALRHDMNLGFAQLSERLIERIERGRTDMIKWSFVFWAGTIVALVFGLAAIQRLGR